ncbi:MAG: HD domain-containing phosphohydrolase [Armatimonadota bacterium]
MVNNIGNTIMIVDDSLANLKLLQDILQASGYRVLAFLRGTLALQAVVKNLPDLILLDINMPEMDGFEVCRRMKVDTRVKDIPVIFLSGRSELADKLQAFVVGGVDYITKPFQFAEVQARVETHLALRRLRRELEQHNLHLEELVQAQVREISESQVATIFALAKLAESRDDDTGKHLERVQLFCELLAKQLRNTPSISGIVNDAFVDYVGKASPLHDIGKVGIPDAILLKPGKHTPEEFDIMKQHTVIGAQTLATAQNRYPRNQFISMGVEIARSHHERWDGTGYPNGLAGAAIPLAARIMAVTDVYDALRSTRCYKEAFTHEKSCGIILQGRNTQFDPVVVDAFLTQKQEFERIYTEMDDA